MIINNNKSHHSMCTYPQPYITMPCTTEHIHTEKQKHKYIGHATQNISDVLCIATHHGRLPGQQHTALAVIHTWPSSDHTQCCR